MALRLAGRLSVSTTTPSSVLVMTRMSELVSGRLAAEAGRGCSATAHEDAGRLTVPDLARRPLLPQQVLDDLLGRRLRQFVHDLEIPRHHEVGQLVDQVPGQVLQVDRRAWRGH